MATKKNTVKDVKAILNDSKLQNYNTNFTISKKRKSNGGNGNGGTKQPTLREIMLDVQKDVKDLQQWRKTVDKQFKSHGWTK